MNATLSMSGTRASTVTSLAALARGLSEFQPRLVGSPRLAVSGLFQDSRKVVPGAMFAARADGARDGLDFWRDAQSRGAVALLRGQGRASDSVPGLEVSDVRRAIARAAEIVYENPTRRLGLAGITGTNGKTTTAWLTELAIGAAGARAARLGTLGFSFEGKELPGSLTTPEADDISRCAAEVVAAGGTHLVIEVSSHALAQARVDALCFEVAAFSNLTQDHLDYHADMTAYAAAKRRLFSELAPRHAVINVDDAFGAELAREHGGLTVSSQRPADVFAEQVRVGAEGIEALVHARGETYPLSTRLVGRHNLDNLLLSLGIVAAFGLPLAPALAALEQTGGVPGRFERCDQADDDLRVLVDYAHTPGALERVLVAARPLAEGKLICVFGCGGDRDRTKRPEMGAVAGRLADCVLVTNDNPRTEDPLLIAQEIVSGLARETAAYSVQLDRSRAIERAVLSADRGDVVVIAGKGHEPYQLVQGEVLAFDDRVQARRALALRRGEKA